MNPELSLAAGFMMGLAGSVHCLAMCGAVAGSLGAALPDSARRSTLALAGWLILFNTGRIASYALAGALAGALGAGLLDLLPAGRSHAFGQVIAGLFMIALGLYIAGWWSGLARLERPAQRLWERVRRAARPLFPITRRVQALGVGLLWGWLPCGLVYAALAWALAAGSAATGALLMLAFGLGTLAALMASGLAADAVARRPVPLRLRRGVGLLLVLAGVVFSLGLHNLHPDTGAAHAGHHAAR